MARRDEDIGDWIEGEAHGGGLAVVGWGLGSVAAFVLAFASWQYAQPRPLPVETARVESGLPDPSEVTGSIATTDRGQTTVQASRVVGAARVAPLPLAANETVATSRDIEQLRSELREIQRRIVQIGMAGDGMSRRVDRIDERLTTLAAREPSPPPGGEAVRTVEAAPVESPARLAERLPTPQPKPAPEPAPLAPPTAAFDADGPATTGAVPKTTPPIAALPAIVGQPAAPAAEHTDPVETKPSEARAPETRATETKPADAKTARDPAANRSARTQPSTAPLTLRPPAPTTPASPSARPETPAPRVEAPAAAPRPVAEAAPPAEEARPAPPVRMATATPAAPPPPAAAPVNGSGQAAIDLGGYRTLASLRRSWSDMTIRHGDLSKGLEPLARLRETDSGMEARLLAGPFADQTEAAKACLRLKAVGATCAVTTFSGQPIGGLR